MSHRRDHVEAGDTKDFLSRFAKSSLPTGKKLEAMINSVALMIDGYNHDPREIYAIPAVRAFYKQLWRSGLTGCIFAIWTART